jgi:ABC-type multidrug transport system permease subunit
VYGFHNEYAVQSAGQWPGRLRAVADVNPFSLAVAAARGLMHGTATTAQIGWAVLACAALVAVFAPLTLHLYGASAEYEHPTKRVSDV